MVKNWHCTREDADLVIAIVNRAASSLNLESLGVDRLTLSMDLRATHLNGCPLDLRGLLDAQKFDFTHDICGIVRHINRVTGKLGDYFLPRYAAKQHSE